MAEARAGSEQLRPAFRRVIERWNDVSVSAEESGVVTIRRSAPSENVALLVVGKNKLDTGLFERCAAYYLGRFVEDGWSVKLLDVDVKAISPTMEPRKSTPGPVVAKVIAETPGLRYLQLFTHSRQAINLSDSGSDFVVDEPPHTGNSGIAPIRIAQLRRAEGAAKDGWVDVFGCHCRPNAEWASALAKALNWPVRTVYPGYGINFPSDGHFPKSAIPFTTRAFANVSAFQNGWAVWFPGSDRPVRVSEPGETARRFDDSAFDHVEHLLVTVLSVGLERVRDFRKLRRLAALARK